MNRDPHIDPDPIGEYLRDNLPTTVEPHPAQARPISKLSAPKLAAWALVPFMIAGVLYLAIDPGATARSRRPSRFVQTSGPPSEPQPRAEVVGRVVLVTTGVTLTRADRSAIPEAGQDLMSGDVVQTQAGASVGLDIETAQTVVLGPDSRLVLGRGPSMTLERGVLSLRVDAPRDFFVHCSNATVTARDAVLMLEAHDGLLQRVAVVEGAASVLRLADDVAFRVTRAKALETHGWTIAAGLADRDLVDKLDAVTALVLGPPEDPAVETDAINSSTGGQHKPSLVKRIRKALADDDVGLALDLVENEGAGFKDAEYLLAAADAYKQASQWTEAAQQYLAAYESANGKEAERALLRAAQIHLKNLGDPANAAALLDEYFERFPAGAYLDEAIYLAAVIQVRLGDDDQARSYYDEYLTLYPDGPQAVRVHIALARILALRFSDCPAALAHAAAAQSMAKGPEVEKQLAKVVTTCSVADTE